MTQIKPLLVLLVTHLFAASGFAQIPIDSSLATYLKQIQQTYETGSIKELKNLFVYKGQSAWLDWIQTTDLSRQQGVTRIIEANEDSATVLMFFKAAVAHPYFSTMFQSGLSGFYKLRRNQKWRIADKVAIDRANRIRQHALNIAIDPGIVMQVIDTLLIDVADPLGFWMTLNSKANVTQVALQGKEIDFTFQSGLLWISETDIQGGKLSVTYSLDTTALNSSENAYFGKDYAYLRQDFWHPMMRYGSTHDIADFSISIQIPADYELTTSFPVASQIRNGTRYIQSESTYPAADLALLYDQEWEAKKRQHASITFEIFATPDYKPKKDTLFEELTSTYDLLTSRFGKSPAHYLGVAQSRVIRSNGWHGRTNSIITSWSRGEYNMIQEPHPKAIVPHEISHTWTDPTGRARMFLMEGWATFIEPYFLRKTFGDSTVQAFWKFHEEHYLKEFDGNTSLWEDENNNGVSYSKGAWVLKIIHDWLGEKTFEAGFKNYIQNTITQEKDIYAFAKSMSAAAGFDIWPMLETWLKSRHIPEVKAWVQDGHLVIEQTGDDIFQFPLEVRLEAASDSLTQTYTVDKKTSRFPVDNAEAITNIHLDPHDEMLLTVRE